MKQEELLHEKAKLPGLTTRRSDEELPPLETKRIDKKNYKFLTGFTLFEVALAMALFALAASGSLSLFISCSRLTDSAGQVTRMIERAREELEDRIQRTDFEGLDDYFILTNNPDTMSLVCYVQDHSTLTDLKQVRVVVTYREASKRIIGEDVNLNGILDDGEDTNGDSRLTSPCEIATFIRRKE